MASGTGTRHTDGMEDFAAALDTARRHTDAWLATLPDRPVPPQATTEQVMAALGERLPDHPGSPEETIDLLGRAGEPGLTAMPAGRFFGFVIGGSYPAALAADCLATAWDQNCGLRDLTPTHTAVEDIASSWLLDLLGLPAESAVGFTTGATTANVTALTSARDEVLRRVGWDAARLGLAGGPRVRVLAGEERHVAVDLALRYAGIGEPEPVAADEQGRMRPEALAAALEKAEELYEGDVRAEVKP